MSYSTIEEFFTSVFVDGVHQYVSSERLRAMTCNLQAHGYEMEIVSQLGAEANVYFTKPVNSDDTILDVSKMEDPRKFLVFKSVNGYYEAHLQGSKLFRYRSEIDALTATLQLQANGYTCYWQS